jgi:hypothetical protein
MAGILFILFLLMCFGLLVFAMWLPAWWARRHGRRGWPYGIAVFLVAMGLLFWDWLPMEISYKNKCEHAAGLTVYKTPEQWQQENPGVWETLGPGFSHGFILNKETNSWDRYKTNDRFAEVRQKIKHWFMVVETRVSIIDLQNDAPVIVYTDFSTSYRFFMVGGIHFRNFKFWMEKRGCRWAGAFNRWQPRTVTNRLDSEEERFYTLQKTFTAFTGGKQK